MGDRCGRWGWEIGVGDRVGDRGGGNRVKARRYRWPLSCNTSQGTSELSQVC